MGKIYVFVVPSVSPDGDGAKSVLTKPVIKKIEDAMTSRAIDALPSDTYSGKDGDKPKGKSDNYAANAVKIVPQLKLSVETAGSKLSVDGKLKIEFEAVKLPNKKGNLLAAGSSGASKNDRGTVDKDLIEFTGELLDNLIGPIVSKATSSSAFKEFVAMQGL